MRVFSKSQNKFIDVADEQTNVGGYTGSGATDRYQALKQSIGLLLLSNAKKTSDIATAIQLMEPAKPSAAQETKKMSSEEAERIVSMMEDLYYGTEGGPLAYGRVRGMEEFTNAKFGKNPYLSNYLAQRQSIRPKLARAMGDVGNLSAPEQEAAVAGIPTGFSTPEEAQMFFASTREKLGLKPRDLSTPNVNQSNQSTSPNKTAPAPKKNNKNILQGPTLPIVGGVLGALAGTVVPGIGNVVGAAAGAGGGEVIRKGMADLTNTPLEESTIMNPKGDSVPHQLWDLGKYPLTMALASKVAMPLLLSPFRNALAARAAGTASTAPIIEAGKEYVQKDPFAQSALNKVTGSLPENINTSDLVKQLQVWGRAYKSGGDVKSTAIANLFNKLYGAGRLTLSNLSPETSLAQTGLHNVMNIKNILGNLLRIAGSAAVGFGAAKGAQRISGE